MWVNSKTAAGALGVSNKSVEKACLRATKANKKICKIKSHICNFIYVDGIGRGGKVLQIWLDEQSQKLIDKGDSSESFSDTRTNRTFEKQGLQGGSLCRAWQGEYKSSKDWQDEVMYKAVANKSATSYSAKAPLAGYPEAKPRKDKDSINDEKYNKTSYETQKESMDKSSQSSTIADIGSPYAVGTSVFANFSGGLATTLKVHKEKEVINDEKNKAKLSKTIDFCRGL